MELHDVSRRTLLKGGGAAIAGVTALQATAGAAHAVPAQVPGEEVVPWLDRPAPNPFPDEVPRQLEWEALEDRLTPREQFFVVRHYDQPALDPAAWRLEVAGLVERPLSLTLADLRARPRRTVEFTMECSGNTGLPFFIGGVGNARWAGAQLAPLLRRAGLHDRATEIVFWGADAGPVTIRDNSGILATGRTGTGEPDPGGAFDLTITERFARSMSVEEALSPANLLCWEMNGGPLPPEHGAPVRLIAPGWYGVANVKWLTRIEVRDQRFAGRFMARDYVTIREETADGAPLWTASTVGHDRLKSAPARVTRRDGRYAVLVAAWGAEIAAVQVQVDDGPWRAARRHRWRRSRASRRFAWTFWSFPWGRPSPGEHRIRSRAIDVHGNVQPAPDDPFLASKVTYWESNGQITRRVLVPAAA